MITVRTQPWNSEDTGKNHILTTYQVGLTADFTLASNVLAEVAGDTNNGMLSIGKIELALPEGTVWYTRFKRTFDDGTTEDTFSPPEPVYSSDVNNNKFIKSTSLIEKPSVRVEDKESYLYIESSEAKIDGSDGHLYTTTLIYSAGELVYKNMKDEDNLTSLSIPINILNFKSLDMLTIYVIYGTSNSAESPAGKAILNTSKLKFSLSGNFVNIPYNKNELYTLTSVDNNVVISTAFLYNGAGAELGEYHLLTFLNKQDGIVRYSEIYIDSEHLVPDSIYTLRINVASTSGAIVEIKNYIITTEELDSPFVIDKDYTYSKIEYKLYNGGVNGYIPTTNNDSFNISLASNYKDILLSSVAYPYSLSKYKFYPNNLELAVSKDLDLNMLTTDAPKLSFFTKDKRAIVVLAKDTSNIRVVEFTYNPFDNTTLVKTSSTDYAIANAVEMIENGGVALSDEETLLYYLTINAAGESELGKINIATHAVTLLAARPDNIVQANLVNMGGNRLLSTKGNLNYDTFYLYSAETNDWASYGATYPVGTNFFNANIGIVKKNGKVFLIPAKGTAAKYLVTLDVKEKTYTTDTVDIPESMVVSDIIREATGAFIIIVKDELNPGSKGIIYYY